MPPMCPWQNVTQGADRPDAPRPRDRAARWAGFAALVIAFSGGAGLLFFTFYRDAKDAAVAKLHEEQRIHARQAARGIEDFFSTWTLYTPVPGSTGRSALERFAKNPSISAMVTEMLKGREGVATYTSDGVGDRETASTRNCALYAPIRLGNAFWSIVVTSTERELLAGLNSFRNRLAIVVGLVYVGGMLLAGVAARAWLTVREQIQRRLAEDAIRSSERLRALMASAVSDVLYYLEVERDGGYRFLSVNPAFLRATSSRSGRCRGRPSSS